MRRGALKHEFIESAPSKLEEGVLYVSMVYATVLHKCCCGCGNEVVTPLSPTDWRLTFDGATISLHPSLGNWGLECQSHYWIERSKVRWAHRWAAEEDRRAVGRVVPERQFGPNARGGGPERGTDPPTVGPRQWLRARLRSWWSRLRQSPR